jgi:hypothetical protein
MEVKNTSTMPSYAASVDIFASARTPAIIRLVLPEERLYANL